MPRPLLLTIPATALLLLTLLIGLIGLIGPVSAAQAKSLEECFADNVWYELGGKDAQSVGERYELVAHCLCPTGAERAAADMNVYCRTSGQDFACYKGSSLANTQTGPFEAAIRKACQ